MRYSRCESRKKRIYHIDFEGFVAEREMVTFCNQLYVFIEKIRFHFS